MKDFLRLPPRVRFMKLCWGGWSLVAFFNAFLYESRFFFLYGVLFLIVFVAMFCEDVTDFLWKVPTVKE